MRPIDKADALACLKQAYAQLRQEKVEGTVVMRLAEILFEARIDDLEAGRERPTKFRRAKLIALIQEKHDVEESGFDGKKSYQAVLVQRIAELDPYRTDDGRYIRVGSPKHRVKRNEVHYYLDIEEVTHVRDEGHRIAQGGDIAGNALFQKYREQLPSRERARVDNAIHEGGAVEISVGTTTTRRHGRSSRQIVVYIAVGLLLSSLALAGGWYYRRYVLGKPARSSVDVRPMNEASSARIIEDRPHTRLTPAMYWVTQTAAANGVCDEHNNPFVSLQWDVYRPVDGSPQPPYVLLKNGALYQDNVNAGKHLFYDHDVLPGRSYTYALGKRDDRSGGVTIGQPQTAFTWGCGHAADSMSPLVALFPDPPSGKAPVSITFAVTIADDEAINRPVVWDFGDGSPEMTSTEHEIRHVFRFGGEFTVQATYTDASGNTGSDERIIMIVGPPPPAPTGIQDPHLFWHGGERAAISNVVSTMGDAVTITVNTNRLLQDADGHPISFRWAFGDCIEGQAPFRGPHAKSDSDCFNGPSAEPRITRSFTMPGQHRVIVEVTRDNGDISTYNLGELTVLPTEDWYQTQPNPEMSREFWQQIRRAAADAP